MKYNGTTVPNYRDDTYNKDEVHRKSAEELYDTAFNEDQQKVLDEFEPSGGGSLPAVTTADNGDVLTVVDGEWEKAEPGFKCSEETSTTTYFDGSLTTSSMGGFYGVQFTPTQPIVGDSVTVTVNGTEYELPKTEHGYGEEGAGPIFTTYPYFISIGGGDYFFFTTSAGTYSVKMEGTATTETIETSECFKKAVKSVGTLKYVKDDPSDNGGVIENLIGDNIPSASRNQATGDFSHAEGGIIDVDPYSGTLVYYPTNASGQGSHAEGMDTTASGTASHAEGRGTVASNFFSHAEGDCATASGRGSHAEGLYAVASGDYSHAEGEHTEAWGRLQHVFGKYNVVNNSYVEIVGNGTMPESRSNARTLDWNGNEWLAGSLTLGNTTLTEAQLQQLLALLN